MALLWDIRDYPGGLVNAFLAPYEASEPKLFARAYEYLHELQQKGNEVKEPVSKGIGHQLFELRPHTDEVQLRLIYYFSPTEKKVIVFVNCFVKQTEETPKPEKELAKRRRREREEQLKSKQKTKKQLQGKRWSNGNGTYH